MSTFAASSSSSASKSAALIFLHGLGDTPAGWSSLQFSLPQLQPRLQQCHFVFPAAPIIGISINGGAQMPGWFDLYDWPVAVGIQDDRMNKYKAVQQVEDEITKVQEQYGIPRHRIVVGGFSQGAAIALLTAYHASEQLPPPRPPLAACVSLSGWWTLNNEKGSHVINGADTPLFWAHGKYDDKVLFPQQAYGIQQLSAGGVTNMETHEYPMGHESRPAEIQALAAFLDKLLFDNDNNDDNTDKQQQQQQQQQQSSEL